LKRAETSQAETRRAEPSQAASHLRLSFFEKKKLDTKADPTSSTDNDAPMHCRGTTTLFFI